MAGLEHLFVQNVEIHDEALLVELLRLKGDLELPGVPVERDARTRVPSDMVGKVAKYAIRYGKHDRTPSLRHPEAMRKAVEKPSTHIHLPLWNRACYKNPWRNAESSSLPMAIASMG
jgi:hypothetical protein